MTELDAAHYDRVFATSPTYKMSPDAAPWAPLWRWIAARVRGRDYVVDFGCGPGHLAELLHRGGHQPSLYLGVDFSAEALRQARIRAPGYSFVQNDLIAAAREQRTRGLFTAVFCEVLEHVAGDLELLHTLPPRTRVLATVPSYDTVGHVRHFPSFRSVCERYEEAVDLSHIVRLDRCFGFAGASR